MAYFQIDKNPKKKFFDSKIDRIKLTSEDYEEAADALIKNAKEYYLFIIKACLSKQEWDTPDTNDFEFEECSTHYLDVTKGGECVRKYS